MEGRQKSIILTAFSGVSVVVSCETAWAVEPLPAVVTDVLARLVAVTLPDV